jgi:hypothetical protein
MNQEQPGSPWWKHGFVWLVIAGPAVVVVASLVTVWVAARSPDVVLTDDYYRRAAEVRKSAGDHALMPALQGRNHAASPPAR